MSGKRFLFAAAVVFGVASVTPASAQNEQFIPILSYRTGAYAVNGVPFANGANRLSKSIFTFPKRSISVNASAPAITANKTRIRTSTSG